MCMMCDGATIEQVRQHLYEQICAHGFTMIPVGRSLDHDGWAYTVGLVDKHDHPELVIAGVQLRKAVTVLDVLARSVIEGERFDAGHTATVFNGEIGFVDVHAVHIQAGLMDGWLDYYRAAGRRDLGLRALQVVLPDGKRCYEHQTTQPRLDNNRHLPFYGPNRATRRAHSRRRRT